MERRAFRIAYDGRPYRGFQRQPDVPTVEDAVLAALRRLDVAPEGEPPPGYAAAGRTDAGVSALAQTIALDSQAWLTPAALNSELPGAIRSWASASVPPDFHATHDAASRTYTYFLLAPAARLDRARTAASRLSGRHDYHNLTTDDEGTTRDVSVAVDRDGDFLVLTATAGGFPRHLVRRLVTLVDRAAHGDADTADVDRALDTAPLDGPGGIPPAPAYPLVLTDVAYPDVRFDRDAARPVAARFAALDRQHRSRARAAARIAAGIDPSGPGNAGSSEGDDPARGNP